MTESLTFLHAADLHLGAPFRGLAKVSPAWAARLVQAIPEAFDRVIDAAISRKVDFVVIAGDVFDGESVNEPILSNFILKTGMAVNILSADVKQISGKRYGQMTIERPKKDADAQLLIDTLTKEGIKVQEVRP